MSLLPTRMQVSDDMPMSLGKAIAREIAPKVDRIAAFNTGNHSHLEYIPERKVVRLTPVAEADCKQIKGAAQENALGAGTDLASAPVAAPPIPQAAPRFKVGDRVRLSEECVRMNHIRREFSPPWVITRIADGFCYDRDGSYACLEDIEHDIPPEPQAQEGGWIEWKGGANPLPRNVRCEVRLINGEVSSLGACKSYIWSWGSGEIVAYRVIA